MRERREAEQADKQAHAKELARKAREEAAYAERVERMVASSEPRVWHGRRKMDWA